MSALSGSAIDNCYIDVDAPEIPIMDGSGSTFVFLIRAAGIEEQDAPRKFVRVKINNKLLRALLANPETGSLLNIRTNTLLRRPLPKR